MSKEENRFEERKHKDKQRKYLRDVLKDADRFDDDSFIGKMSHVHGVPCSCPMCCNPRHSPYNKSDKLTLQERRANESLHDEDDKL